MHKFSGFLALFALTALTGCYTQLATRGYGSPDPAYSRAYPPGDSIRGDSVFNDSAQALASGPMEADTLAPRNGTPTVIVNNYYQDPFHYRGYAGWEWDYPTLAFGFYSSRYDHYSRPWWWDHPRYSRRHYHSHRHHGHYGHPSYRPPRPGTPVPPPGPYQSEKRLFNPDPSYAPVRKGRRSEPPATATPKEAASPAYTPPASSPPPPESGSKQESSQSGSSSGSASGSGSQEAQPAQDGSVKGADYPVLRKGKRR